MKVIEIQTKLSILRQEMAYWLGVLDTRKCANCMFLMSGDKCDKARGQVPPKEVQESGCPQWEFDEIPF